MRRIRNDVLTFGLLWIPYALLVRHFWFITDDAFIAYRYARNLADGFGLRFNPSETLPVEGYSDFLWVLFCAACEALHLNMLIIPPLASFLCGSLLLLLVYVVSRRRLGLNLPTAALATLTLGCFPPFALWSTSGLETMPFALLVFAVFERLILRKDGPDAVGGGVLGLLMALIRLEGLAWFLAILILAVLVRRRNPDVGGVSRTRGSLLPAVFIVGIGYACYFAWRYWYYQLPLPNTVYAKGEMTPERLLRGVNYVATFALTFLTPLLVVPGTWLALRKKRIHLGLPIAILAWAFPAYAVLVTGDFMVMGRFLIPGLAFNAILFAWLIDALRGDTRARRTASWFATAAVIVVGLLPALPGAANVHLVPKSIRERFCFRYNVEQYKTELDQWYAQQANADDWTRRGKGLREYVRQRSFDDPHPSFVAGAVGAVGYYSDLFIYDKHGLVTPDVARRATSPDEELRSPGHDKYVPAEYFLKDRPTILEAYVIDVADPCFVARTCSEQERRRHSAKPEQQLDKLYTTDVARVVVNDHPYYVITWTRIADGVDPAAAADEFRKKLEILTRGSHLPVR